MESGGRPLTRAGRLHGVSSGLAAATDAQGGHRMQQPRRRRGHRCQCDERAAGLALGATRGVAPRRANLILRSNIVRAMRWNQKESEGVRRNPERTLSYDRMSKRAMREPPVAAASTKP